MFDIHDKELIFEGLTIGYCTLPTSTLRDRVVKALRTCNLDSELTDDAEQEVDRLTYRISELSDTIDRLISEKAKLEDVIAEHEAKGTR